MSLLSHIESILFVASQPLSTKNISKILNKKQSEVEEAIETLSMKYNHNDSGIHILRAGNTVQMSTNPENIEALAGFVKNEVTHELTKAQLETLTVVAYRGPITRPELEEIRGVNCMVILRNLLVRGLITESDDPETIGPVYELSTDALAHLGLRTAEELPRYIDLSEHENIEKMLQSGESTN